MWCLYAIVSIYGSTLMEPRIRRSRCRRPHLDADKVSYFLAVVVTIKLIGKGGSMRLPSSTVRCQLRRLAN